MNPQVLVEALASVSEGILLSGADGRIIFLNAAFQAITGFSEADLLGKTCSCMQGPETDRAVVARIREDLGAHRPFAGEILNYTKSGATFWNELTVAPIFGDDGQVSHYIGITRDVTQRRTYEAKILAMEAYYRFILDHAFAGIVVHDKTTTITYANPMAEALLGVDRADMIGATKEDVRWRFVRETGERLRHEEFPVSVALTTKAVVRDVVVGNRRTSDDKTVWYLGNAYPVVGPDGDPDKVIVTFTDITRLKTVEHELQEAKTAAEAASLAKANFLSNMSHEIRTPLTAIIGFSGVLSDDESLSERARRNVRRIADGGQMLLALVNNILDFSRLEAGQFTLDPQAFDPRGLMDTIIQLLEPQAAAKGLSVITAIDDALPPLVLCDSARVKQIVLNLVTNALKFTDKGSVTLAATYDDAQGKMRVAITDTGLGIPAEKIDRLFGRFSQLDAAMNRKYGGSGLGLAICKELVELMGGSITVRSEAGVGSSFTFSVLAPRVSQALDEPRSRIAAAPPPSHADLKVLLVDDVLENRELVRTLLEREGVHVEEAEDGRYGVQAADKQPYDVILMDMQMPGLDGLAATREIRASNGPNRNTPILALSANVFDDQLADCIAAGMNDHIAKPVSPDLLRGKILDWSRRALARRFKQGS